MGKGEAHPKLRLVQHELMVETRGRGSYEITDRLRAVLESCGIRNGHLTVFCCHTSCSLVIMENADPSAWRDLERFLERLVPECDPDYSHTHEGPDDMPSHIRMALTRTSETIPVLDSRLALGTWQGVFLWEHRNGAHRRKLVGTVLGQ